MHRIAPLLAAAFALFLLPAAPGRAESAGATLDGTWMAMGDVLGLVPDNVEVLAIAGHAAEAALWRVGAEGPVPTARGALAFGAMDLAFSGQRAIPLPAARRRRAGRWWRSRVGLG